MKLDGNAYNKGYTWSGEVAVFISQRGSIWTRTRRKKDGKTEQLKDKNNWKNKFGVVEKKE